MKTITGRQTSRENSSITLNGFSSETAFALNCFYNRFDTSDFSKDTQELERELCDDQHFSVKQEDVEKAFFCGKINKSQGPDNICGWLLKTCARELSPVFHKIFNRSLVMQQVPQIWKNVVVVPVPKSSCPGTLNDFRLLAYT